MDARNQTGSLPSWPAACKSNTPPLCYLSKWPLGTLTKVQLGKRGNDEMVNTGLKVYLGTAAPCPFPSLGLPDSMMSDLSYSQLSLAHWPGSAFMHGTDEIVSASPTLNYNLMGG